jgi:Transposase DDE domain
MHQAGCRIVTRLKKNTKLTITRKKHMPSGGPILADRFGELPKLQSRNRRNPLNCEVREIEVRIDEPAPAKAVGKVIRVLTNDLTSLAQTITDLYQRHWAIELHFRWIKPSLKIRTFSGTSDDAVRTQVYIALIVFLLLHLAHVAEKISSSILDFTRLVRTHLMSRRDISALNQPNDPPPRPDIGQYRLDWSRA